MTRLFIRTLLLLAFLALPGICLGADVIKLLYGSAIYGDDQGVKLNAPSGIACSGDQFLVIADSGNGRLLKLTYQDKVASGFMDIRVPELPFPIKVQINPQGEILALDGRLHTLVRLSPEGKVIGAVGLKDVPEREGMIIRSFTLDDKGNIYLLDIFRGRVVVLSPEGQYVRSIAFKNQESSISDVAVNFKGDAFIVDSANDRVYVARNSDTFEAFGPGPYEEVNFPTGITTDANGAVYLVDQNGGSILALDPEGNFQGKLLAMGWKEGLLHYPVQACLDGKGQLFVVDRGNDRVQVFKVVGK